MELGSETTPDVPARFALVEVLIHQVSSNDEVERRGVSPASNEGSLSRSSILSLAQRRRAPRSLEPIVRGGHAESFAHVNVICDVENGLHGTVLDDLNHSIDANHFVTGIAVVRAR